jgi:hypothetical protein
MHNNYKISEAIPNFARAHVKKTKVHTPIERTFERPYMLEDMGPKNDEAALLTDTYPSS